VNPPPLFIQNLIQPYQMLVIALVFSFCMCSCNVGRLSQAISQSPHDSFHLVPTSRCPAYLLNFVNIKA